MAADRLDLSDFPEHARLRAVLSLMICAGDRKAARGLVARELADEVANLTAALVQPNLAFLAAAIEAQRAEAERALRAFAPQERQARRPREERKVQCVIAGEHLLFRLAWEDQVLSDHVVMLFVKYLGDQGERYRGPKSERKIRAALHRFRGVAHWAATHRLFTLANERPDLDRFLSLSEAIRARGSALSGKLGEAMKQAARPARGIAPAKDLDELLALQPAPSPELLREIRAAGREGYAQGLR